MINWLKLTLWSAFPRISSQSTCDSSVENFVLLLSLKSLNFILIVSLSASELGVRAKIGKWSLILYFTIPEIALGRELVKMLSSNEGLPLWFKSGKRVALEINGKQLRACIVHKNSRVGLSLACSNKSIFQSPIRKVLFLVKVGEKSFNRNVLVFRPGNDSPKVF